MRGRTSVFVRLCSAVLMVWFVARMPAFDITSCCLCSHSFASLSSFLLRLILLLIHARAFFRAHRLCMSLCVVRFATIADSVLFLMYCCILSHLLLYSCLSIAVLSIYIFYSGPQSSGQFDIRGETHQTEQKRPRTQPQDSQRGEHQWHAACILSTKHVHMCFVH